MKMWLIYFWSWIFILSKEGKYNKINILPEIAVALYVHV